jgi:hypothetical protein
MDLLVGWNGLESVTIAGCSDRALQATFRSVTLQFDSSLIGRSKG